MINWYSFLNRKGKDNLLSNEKIEEENIIVCQQLKYRQYAKFKNHIHLRKYMQNTEYNNKCFYELITEKKFRKPYFDIDIDDIKLDEKIIIDEIILSISKILEDAVILIYSSHTKDKISFHIVIGNYYFINNQENKNFYQKVIENLKKETSEYVDSKVYNTVQQFRILGSHKYEKTNVKIFREDLSKNFNIPDIYKELPTAIENYLLISSLVTMTEGAKYLSGYEKKEEIKNIVPENGFSSISDLEDILNIFYSVYSYDIFQYLNTIDNNGNLLITFKRLSPSYCNECNRRHEHENPFVTVNGIYRNIFFYCRRKEGEEVGLGKHIGSLGPEIIPELKIEDISNISNICRTEGISNLNICRTSGISNLKIKNVPIIINDEEETNEGTSIIDQMKVLNTSKKKHKPVIVTSFLQI